MEPPLCVARLARAAVLLGATWLLASPLHAAASPAAPPAPVSRATTAPASATEASAADPDADPGMSPRSMPHYRLLEQALERYRALALQPGLTGLPPLPRRSIKGGESWQGTPALRRLLLALGDLPPVQPAAEAPASAAAQLPASPPPLAPPATANPPAQPPAAASPSPDPQLILDPTLVQALQHFQERHGLDTDGVLGPATWRALTTPLGTRLQQIERTLANWRALPANPHRRAIFINIPRFRLYAVSGFAATESQMLRINVVVGRAVKELRTPVFTEDMTHVIFRPYWEVPASIARNEIVPAARRDGSYLARNHFELVDRAGRIVAATPAALDQLASGALRVRQRPGSDNALGAVKFMLPNAHSVYLHDTPARTLFARSRRDFSHGCIRVEDPAALAQFVLQDVPAWTPERIAEAMAGTVPVRVDLPEPVRVYIVYGTAIAREDGSVLFLDDVYDLER